MATSTTKIPYIEGAAPATPSVGEVVTYAKADGLMYSKDDAGAETLLSGGTPATRASLGLDTTDSPQFAGLNIGAATDTTVTRTGAGDIAVEGNAIYRAGGTDVPVTDGGTGASSAATARSNLGALADTDAITYLDGTVAAAPATPAAGKLRIYAKTGPSLAVKNDAGVETVLGSGIADQGTITFLDATEAAAPATPAAGKVRIYAKTDGRIYSKDDAGVESGPFSSGSGALVGERKAWDTAATYALHADGSEFEYADLTAFDAFWTRRNVATGDIFNPPGSHTEFFFDAQGDAIWRAMTFPTDGWLVAELSVTGWSSAGSSDQDNMLGIAILDSSGNGFGYAPYQGLFYNINVTAWAYASFGNSATPSAGVYSNYITGGHAWLGIERISSTSYRGAHSTDGSAWDTRPTANTPTAFTPDRIALIRMFSAGAQTVWRRVHRVNIYSVAFP